MWFGFGLITLLIAFGISVSTRLSALWKGQPRTIGGVRCAVEVAKNKGRVVVGRIGVEAPRGYDFRVRRERGSDAWFKRIGISAELEMRDTRFDDAVYLESDDRALAQLLATRPDVRNALLAIVVARLPRCKLAYVRCIQGRLWVVVKPDGADESDIHAAADALVPLLATVATALREHPVRRDVRDPFVRRAVVLLSISTASAVYGVYGVFRSLGSTDILDPWRLFAWTIVPSLVALVLFLAAIVQVLGRSSRTHLVLIEALLVGGAGFVLSGHTLAREANVTFDVATPALVDVGPIRLEHRVRRSKRSTTHTYYLHTDDWRTEQSDTITLEIDQGTYAMLPQGGRARLAIGKGALGFPWVARIERAPPPN